ncbi:MAG: PAS domain S-box protein [Desulfobacterales bacterium]|nr:PAS domain S-box protein [Desulfobacterales bacterium]
MLKKPSYDELINRNLSLEKEVADINRLTETLKYEKKFSETILDSLPGIFYLYDESGILIRWNKNHERITGFAPADLLKRKQLDWFKDDEKQLIIAEIKKVFEKGGSEVETYLEVHGGEKVPFLLTGRRLIVDNKKYLLGVGIDLTKIKHMEEALRRE